MPGAARAFVAAALVVAAAAASAPSFGQSGEFTPEIGQHGKDVVWVPTPEGLVDKMLEMARTLSTDFVVDLGSGDSRIAIAAAKKFGARSLGIEFDSDMVALSRRYAAQAGAADRALFIQADIFQTDFSAATVVTMYLLPSLNIRLRPTILAMRPGTRVVSHRFSMGDWEPDATAWVNDRQAHLWIVPARVEGAWRMTVEGPKGPIEYELKLRQQYQKVEGEVKRGINARLFEAKMAGDTHCRGRILLINLDQYINISLENRSEKAAKSPRSHGDYLSRSEALEILRIKPQTLYCYVSRGYIRSVPQPDGRSSYYLREDVEKVKAKSVARSGHGPAAAGAMRWGEPVILTAITEITEAGPRYRSRLATDLARAGASYESVAEYLWTGEWHEEAKGWRVEERPLELPALLAAKAKLNPDVHILQLLSAATLSLGIVEGSQSERIRSGGTASLSACRLIRCMAGTFGFLSARRTYVPLEQGEPIARGLARALGLSTEAAQALNAALVLIADHELNPATFAARVAASGGSDLHACISAALGVFVGLGRDCDRVERIFASGGDAATIHSAARAMVETAEKLPGFNHPLYPHGDRRARMLIEMARGIGGTKTSVRNMLEGLRRIEDELEMQPRIEVGLVMLCHALRAPDLTAAGLFALGRSAGWVAHVLEQRLQGFMIRPRAQFTGSASAVR